MKPKVSVIVPNYNHARYLKQRIDSILNQSYQDFELILLDDCSTDESREVLLSYQDNPHVSHIVFNEVNAGTAFKQWNKGIALAKGEYIWIAESDDWAKEDFLEVVIGEMEAHPACGLAYTLAHYMQDGVEQWQLNASGKIYYWDGKEYVRKKLAYGCKIYNVSMTVFRKELFAKVNQHLYADMHLCGDWFFYTQLCEQTGVIQIDSPHSYYRMHRSNVHNRAEHEGLTFLEGIKVLEYMVLHCGVRMSRIARFWGRSWVNYKRRYQILDEANLRIEAYMKQHHKLIFGWYLIYGLRKRL